MNSLFPFQWFKKEEIKEETKEEETLFETITDNVKDITVILPTDLRVSIDRAAYDRMVSYITGVHTEVTGLGTVERNGDHFHITEIFLTEQTASYGDAELEPISITKLKMELNRQGKSSKFRFWWHSHLHGVFWSGTDRATCERITNDNFMISLVMDKTNLKTLCRIDVYHPLRVIIDNLEVEIIGEPQPIEDVSEELERKVKSIVNSDPSWLDNLLEKYYPNSIQSNENEINCGISKQDNWDEQMGFM